TRSLPFVALLLLLLGLACGAGVVASARAREATPVVGLPEGKGVSAELVSVALGVTVPNPANLVVVRFGLEPGASHPIGADPDSGLFLVEEGEFTIRVEAAWTLTRGAGLAGAVATAEATGDLSGAVEHIA